MTRRATRWWQEVTAAAESVGDAVREPWADQPLVAADLTDDQRAVLAGQDQPDVPRLAGVDGGGDGDPDHDQPGVPRLTTGNGTGNPPGDSKSPRPYRRMRWNETAEEDR